MKMKNLFYVGVLMLILAACGDAAAYIESAPVAKDGWNVEDGIVFTPLVEDKIATYDVYAWVRHDKSYKYSNLWLKVMTNLDWIEQQEGLVEIPIADKSGKWLGDCSSSMCTARVLLKSNYRFDTQNDFGVEIYQYMREDNLKGIKNVGLEFEKVVE